MTCLFTQPWSTALWLLPLVLSAASQSSAGDNKEQPKATAAAGTRSRRNALEELQSQIRWEYGGWRPIMPGSPFFFVKTSRAVPLDGSASALTPVRMRAPQLHNSLLKDDSKEDLKAEASSASERVAESQSIARQVPIGSPPVGSAAGCCDFQPVLYVKHQSHSGQQAKGSSPAWYAAKPETNLAGDDDDDYQKDAGKPEGSDDLKSSGSQIVHGSPIGDERPQLPHQLLQDGSDPHASGPSPLGLESVLSKLPVNIHPVLQGQGEQIMSALAGLDGSIQPSNIEQLLQHVHASGGVAPDVERLIAAMVNSAHGGQGHGPGLGGPEAHQDVSVQGLPPGVPLAHPGPGGQYGEHPTAPPYHPRPDKNIFRWYPKPRATAPPPHKPTYTEMPKKPGEMNRKQQNSQGKNYGGGGMNEQMLVQNALHAMQNVQHQVMGATPVHLAVVQGPILTGNGVQFPHPGPLQQLEAPPLAHHYSGLDGDVAHADSQQHFVTARPHDPPNFDRQAPRRPPQTAEIVRGRPQGDYDPRQPPRIHVEDVPADVLATGIHPNGHPIRVDGINLNIIAPSQHEPPQFPPRHPQATTSQPSPAPVFTHYHRPEDVASAPFFQHQHHQDAAHDTHQQPTYNATADATGNKEHYYDHSPYHPDDRKQENHSHGDPVYQESQKEGHHQERAPEEDSREPSKEDTGHTSDSETEGDEITETPAPDSKATSEAPQQEQKEKTAQRGAIHFHPIQTPTVQKEEEKAQLYHAYYAPAQHKPPPGYVRMTVEEFNRLFKDAEIQFIGSESDLNKKLSGKSSQSKVQYSQTEDKDSQTSTVKIETVGPQAEEKKVAIKTSVSMSTSTSTGNKGAYHSFIQPRENAGRAASDSPLANLQATTRKTFKTTTSKPSTPENKDNTNSPPNLFGARLKMPRTQKSQS
ncbi:hypothetical protein HPB49_022821 [Dermacentor silvarum]|uniref:Uncharacterized protein n=1 Tax=Dermacentor silvarum TaxID=543639 RepID=A0ACB8D0C7_DERSI|nr:hypothetical protein HPB49_022821 [Dermacentor silvarum]